MPTYHGSDFSGLITVEMGRQILQAATEQSVVLQLANIQRMSTSEADFPVLSALPTAGFLGAVGEPKPVTEMKWTRERVVAEEVAALLPVPTAYLDDAQFNIWGEVRPRLAEAIAVTIDRAILSGLDAPASFPDGGVLAAAAGPFEAAAVGSQPDIIQTLSDAMQAVEDSGMYVNGFAARTTIAGAMRNVRATTGEWLIQQPQGPQGVQTLWGAPLSFTRIAFGAAEADLIAGDWTALIVGLREDMRFDISTEGVIRGENGQILVSAFQDDVAIMRVYMRLGAVLGHPIVHQPNSDEVALGTPFAYVKRPPSASGSGFQGVSGTSGSAEKAQGATKKAAQTHD